MAEIASLVGGMGLAADAGWVAASAAIAEVAATLRSSVIDWLLRSVQRIRAMWSIPSRCRSWRRRRAAPARWAFSFSRLSAMLHDVEKVDDDRDLAVGIVIASIADRLGEGVPAPRHHGRRWLRRSEHR